MHNQNSERLTSLLRYWESDFNNIALARDILKLLLQQKSFERAHNFIDDLSTKVLISVDIRYLIAQIYLASGSLIKARNCFVGLVEIAPEIRSYNIGLCYFFEKDFDCCIDILKPYLKPENANVSVNTYILFARSQYHLGLIEAAFNLLTSTRAYFITQNLTEFDALLSILALDLNLIEEAKYSANEALKSGKNPHDAILAMASCSVYEQEIDTALHYSLLGVKNYPSSGRIWSVLGQSQLMTNSIDKAHQSLVTAVDLMTDHIGTFHLKAWCEILLNDMLTAKKSFNLALKLDKNFSESHGGLAVVNFHLKNYIETKQLVSIALKLDKNCFSALYAKSLLAKKDNDVEGSENIINKLLKSESHRRGVNYSSLIESNLIQLNSKKC
jgi:tetratricopeptide (TPR) repeat protein